MGRFHVVRAGLAACALMGSAAIGQNVGVNNGSPFTTTTGDAIQAHGAGIIKVGNYYYLLGENRDGWLFKAVVDVPLDRFEELGISPRHPDAQFGDQPEHLEHRTAQGHL